MTDQPAATSADAAPAPTSNVDSLSADVAKLADAVDGIMEAIDDIKARLTAVESSKAAAAPAHQPVDRAALEERIARIEGRLKHF